MTPDSQCAQIMSLLKTGPKTTAEILRVVPCIVHSRISDLRIKHGLTILHETTGPGASGSRYTLVSTEAGGDPSPVSGDAGSPLTRDPGRPGVTAPSRSGSDPEQLELVA